MTRIHESTLAKIIPEVCDAIHEGLGEEYLQTPITPEQWEQIRAGFQDKC